MNHLNDEQIQDYLDGNIITGLEAVEAHLKDCPACRLKLKQYQKLYTTLEVDLTPELSRDFTNKVVARVAADEALVPAKKADYSLVLSLASILFGLAGVIIFVDFKPLLEHFNLQSFSQRLNELMPYDLSLVVMVVLILAAVGLIDYLIRHQKRRPITFIV